LIILFSLFEIYKSQFDIAICLILFQPTTSLKILYQNSRVTQFFAAVSKLVLEQPELSFKQMIHITLVFAALQLTKKFE